MAQKPTRLPESSCRILLGELDGAFKRGEHLAGPVDVMQQPVGAVRCHDLMAGSRGDDHPLAGGLRQLFVVPDYPKDFEGASRPSGEFRSNRTFPSSRSAWRERSTPASHCNAICAGRPGGTLATFLRFLVSNDWVEQQDLGRHKKGRCPTGAGRGRRFCGRSADDRSKGHSALALCLFFLISIAPTSTACIDRTGTNSGDTSMAKSSITGDRPSWPVAPNDWYLRRRIFPPAGMAETQKWAMLRDDSGNGGGALARLGMSSATGSTSARCCPRRGSFVTVAATRVAKTPAATRSAPS